jgi:hypothetical protein
LRPALKIVGVGASLTASEQSGSLVGIAGSANATQIRLATYSHRTSSSTSQKRSA